MAIVTRIMGAGIPALSAQNIVGDFVGGLTATGNSQGTALQISAAQNAFTTVASSTGAILPTINPGDSIYVYNGGANTLSVYGRTGESIAGGSANAAFSVAANKGCIFTKVGATTYGVILSA